MPPKCTTLVSICIHDTPTWPSSFVQSPALVEQSEAESFARFRQQSPARGAHEESTMHSLVDSASRSLTGHSRQSTGKAGAYLLHTSQVDFGNTWATHEADSGGYHSYQHSYHKNEEDCSNFQWLPAAQILRSVGNTFLQENERLRCKRTQTKLLRGSLRLIPRTRRVSTGRRLENRRKELFRSDSPQLHSWSRPKWA
jgi:hypothetical protein